MTTALTPAERSLEIVRRLSAGTLRRDPDAKPYRPKRRAPVVVVPFEEPVRHSPVVVPKACVSPELAKHYEQLAQGERAQRCVAWGRERGVPFTSVELADDQGVPTHIVIPYLTALTRTGQLHRAGTGHRRHPFTYTVVP